MFTPAGFLRFFGLLLSGVGNDEVVTAEESACDWDEDVWDKEATSGVFAIGIGDRPAVNVDWGEASRIDSVVEEHEASADSDREDNEDIRGVFGFV